jgi:hypothetical protein
MANGRNHAGIVYWPQERPTGTVIRKLIDYATQTPPDAAANVAKFL